MNSELSELLKILKNYIGDKPSIQEFISYFFSLLIDKAGLTNDERLDERLDEITLARKQNKSTANKIFSGSRPIPKKIARFINAHFTQTNLIDELYKIPDDAKTALIETINKSKTIKLTCTEDDVDEKIASKIQELIQNPLISTTSSKKKTTKLKPYTKKKESNSKQRPQTDSELLSALIHDFNKYLKFCIDTDLRITPMPFDYPSDVELLVNKWKHHDWDFKDTRLTKLKNDIVQQLDSYFTYWSCHLFYDPSKNLDYFIYPHPSYPQSEAEKAALDEKIKADMITSDKLHAQLCCFVKANNLSI